MPKAKREDLEEAACEAAHAICDLLTPDEQRQLLYRMLGRYNEAIACRGISEHTLVDQDLANHIAAGSPRKRVWFLIVDIISEHLNSKIKWRRSMMNKKAVVNQTTFEDISSNVIDAVVKLFTDEQLIHLVLETGEEKVREAFDVNQASMSETLVEADYITHPVISGAEMLIQQAVTEALLKSLEIRGV